MKRVVARLPAARTAWRGLLAPVLLGLLLGSMACPDPSVAEDAAVIADASASDVARADQGGVDQASVDISATDSAADGGDAGFVCSIPEIAVVGPAEDGGAPCPSELADLTGSFSGFWSGRVFGEMMLVGAFDMSVYGNMQFEIACTGDKLWVSGVMRGLAQGAYPFAGALRGSFDAISNEIAMVVEPGYLCFNPPGADAGPAEDGGPADAGFGCSGLGVTFAVGLSGQRSGSSFSAGSWCGESLAPPGGMGEGSWSATQD